jgi:hypothetical protein
MDGRKKKISIRITREKQEKRGKKSQVKGFSGDSIRVIRDSNPNSGPYTYLSELLQIP